MCGLLANRRILVCRAVLRITSSVIGGFPPWPPSISLCSFGLVDMLFLSASKSAAASQELNSHLHAVVLHVHDRTAVGIHLDIGGRVGGIVLEPRRNRNTTRVVRSADRGVRLGSLIGGHPVIVALLVVGGVDIVGNALLPVDHEHLGLARSPGCLQGVVLDRLFAEIELLIRLGVNPAGEHVAGFRGLGLLSLRSGQDELRLDEGAAVAVEGDPVGALHDAVEVDVLVPTLDGAVEVVLLLSGSAIGAEAHDSLILADIQLRVGVREILARKAFLRVDDDILGGIVDIHHLDKVDLDHAGHVGINGDIVHAVVPYFTEGGEGLAVVCLPTEQFLALGEFDGGLV